MTNEDFVIHCQMNRGMANDQISKTIGISESTIGYYREKPNNLISKRSSNLSKNIQMKYILASNKTTREIFAGLTEIKINKKSKK